MVTLGKPTPVNPDPKVYAAIASVMRKLSTTGISKDRRNVQQNYAFRGIDDVYNALSPLLAEAGLCILPRVTSRTVSERTTDRGTVLFSAVVTVEFDLVCAEDGSMHTITTVGEAMDSGDKATNKAMSAAYKYACMQAFCIPTEGDNDADQTTHANIAPMKHEPRPDTTFVDAARVNKVVAVFDSIKAKDLDEDGECLEIYDMHSELAKEPDLYTAVADALAGSKRIGKADWKKAVARGKELAHRSAA